MGLFSGLFGSSESTTEVPDWIKGPAVEMLQRSVDMGKTGYMPWTGPDVAAFDPSQKAAMQNNQNMAAAFGMESAMPQVYGAQNYGGGVWGRSSMPLYEQNMQTLQETRPGQMDYYNSFFVDPTTGQNGARMDDPLSRAQTIAERGWSNGNGIGGDLASWDGGRMNQSTDTYGGGGGGGLLGGYSGIRDMFNGGGPGASGDTYGGLLGGVTNATGRKPGDGLLGGLF